MRFLLRLLLLIVLCSYLLRHYWVSEAKTSGICIRPKAPER